MTTDKHLEHNCNRPVQHHLDGYKATVDIHLQCLCQILRPTGPTMFSTLKYRRTSTHNTKRLVDVRHSSRPRTRGPHLACRACHTKKVKCSGEKDGCERCRSKAILCFYVKQNRTAPESQRNMTTVAYSKTTDFAPMKDISQPLEDTMDSSTRRMSTCLLDTGIESNPEGAPIVFLDSKHTSDEQLWNHPLPSIEDEIGHREGQEMSHDYTHGNAIVECNTDSGFEASQYMDFGENLTMSGQATCDLSEFSNFIYDPISTSLHESDIVHNWAIPLMTPPVEPQLPPLKIPETLDPSTGLLYLSPSTTPPPAASSSTSPYQCQCTDAAVRVLEALQIGNSRYRPSAFERVLRLKTHAIDECTAILDCALCCTSPLVMLLVVICEKLVVSFEAWSGKYRGGCGCWGWEVEGWE
ncbi:hypothetical protein B7494_g5368 [Chlorociboria aeruginascens]|nr:hypothetical protein B7494_g5368 [Chlorociboria aeruginascens]